MTPFLASNHFNHSAMTWIRYYITKGVRVVSAPYDAGSVWSDWVLMDEFGRTIWRFSSSMNELKMKKNLSGSNEWNRWWLKLSDAPFLTLLSAASGQRPRNQLSCCCCSFPFVSFPLFLSEKILPHQSFSTPAKCSINWATDTLLHLRWKMIYLR